MTHCMPLSVPRRRASCDGIVRLGGQHARPGHSTVTAQLQYRSIKVTAQSQHSHSTVTARAPGSLGASAPRCVDQAPIKRTVRSAPPSMQWYRHFETSPSTASLPST